VTRVGKWMRKYSIDEFPQLINVLKGEMSLVGPRPPLPNETQIHTDYHWQRMEVLPVFPPFCPDVRIHVGISSNVSPIASSGAATREDVHWGTPCLCPFLPSKCRLVISRRS